MAKSAKQRFSYVVVDVFTRRALEGNQLAVFTDARQLDAPQMQAIAREMNFSETTFVLPQPAAIEKKQGFKVRIFTPQEELPCAGHPTLGTAYVLQAKNRAAEITLDLRAGKIPVRFENRSGALFGEMRQREPEFGKVHAREPVAAAGCATAWMVANGVLASGKQGMIEQGIEARRPSQLFVRAERNGSKATKVRVGGYGVEVMRGELML